MEIENQKKIAEIIKAWVDRSIYSQAQLARILGVSQPVLNLQLNGKNPFPVNRIKELAEILNPAPDDMDIISSIILGTTPTDDENTVSKQIRDLADKKRKPTRKEEVYLELMKNKQILSRIFLWAELDYERCLGLLKSIEAAGFRLPPPSICMSSDLRDVIASHPFIDLKIKDEANWNLDWYKKTEALWKHFQNEYDGKRRQIFDSLAFLSADEQSFILHIINRLRLPREKKQYDELLQTLCDMPISETPSGEKTTIADKQNSDEK